jgi:hypothetical protein
LLIEQERNHVVRTKQFIGDFYTELKNKTPILDVEKLFNLHISHHNAAEVLAFALLMLGIAPKSDSLFTNDYDPYKLCIYPNPYKQTHAITVVPETADAALRLEILNQGLATHWPEFVQQTKIANKVRKQKQSNSQQALSSRRKKLSRCFSDAFFNEPDQSESNEVLAPAMVRKKGSLLHT